SDLLRKYDFQLAPGQTIEARPMVILRPKHGIRMTFTNTIAPAHLASRETRSGRKLTCPPFLVQS
ncbi:MAG: hypothetical protein WCC03_15950, partial [Candidatus Acidiferrales bacterium]